MKVKNVEILNMPMLKATQHKYMLLKAMYPNLAKDLQFWCHNGLDLGQYERMRKGLIAEVKEEINPNQKAETIRLGAEELDEAATWLAFQEICEDAFREKFAKEVVINMLKDEKVSLEDIQRYIPYISKEALIEMASNVRENIIKVEVMING